MNPTQIILEIEEKLREDQSDLQRWNIYYYNVHKRRYLNDAKTFQTHFKGGKVLEIGSAPYHVTCILKKIHDDVTGVDIDPVRHEKFILDNNLNIIKCNIETESIPLPDNTYHYILFNEVFEHMRMNPIETLKEIHRVLHPDGVLVLTTPNLYAIQNIVNLLLGKGFDNPYEEFQKLESLGQMGHVREYSVPQIKTFLANTGFKSVLVQRNSYTPLKGYLYPFNLVRTLFPRYHTFQMHICKKV